MPAGRYQDNGRRMTVAGPINQERRIDPFTRHDQGSVLMFELVSGDLAVLRNQRVRYRAKRPETGSDFYGLTSG
jgi:hypothetical protein